ncbi:MAG: helix-turn-helix domain-containing protein [Anaerolineae bacterium]|nr:helix-turn-helix domain-containing protein [Anaerolineae bacterium]
MDYHRHVPASIRTLHILESLAAEPGGLTAGQLAKTLDIPHSALHALLNTLKSQDYIVQTGVRQPYQIGPRAQALGQARPSGINALVNAFYEETARHPPTETLALATLADTNSIALILAEAPSAQIVRCAVPVGQRTPAAEHPAGLVLLADLTPAGPERAVAHPNAELHNALQQTRRQTMARSADNDTVTLAVPVCPDGQRPEAALLASIPAFRWDAVHEALLLSSLREMAARLSYRLGALNYTPYSTAQPHPHGPSIPMPEAELHAFLDGPWAARLACIRPDGSPHVVPIWYEWRATFLITAWPGSVWADFVTQNPTVALTIDEPWPPMRRVLVRGQAQALAPDSIPGGIEGLCTRLTVRYLGAPVQSIKGDQSRTAWKAFRILPMKMIAHREQQ